MSSRLSKSNAPKPLPMKASMQSGLESAIKRQSPAFLGTMAQEISVSLEAYGVAGKRKEGLPARGGGGGALMGLESIIGTDERKRILDTNLLPWRMICALRMYGEDDQMMVGTGWLVGPRTLITAGHCVYLNDFGGDRWAKRVEVSPGRSGEKPPSQTVTTNRLSAHAKWVEAVDAGRPGQDFDIGCIHIDEPLGETHGWFGVAAMPDQDLETQMVNISGYPFDRGRGTEQYFHANRVKALTPRRVFYDIDTMGGQSGSPVWIHPNTEGRMADGIDPAISPPTAIAIHAYGIGGGTTALNSAPRIDDEIFDLIQHWINQGHGSAGLTS